MNTTNDQKETSNWMKLIRTTIIGGFLVVMPAYLAILLADVSRIHRPGRGMVPCSLAHLQHWIRYLAAVDAQSTVVFGT